MYLNNYLYLKIIIIILLLLESLNCTSKNVELDEDEKQSCHPCTMYRLSAIRLEFMYHFAGLIILYVTAAYPNGPYCSYLPDK